MVDPGDEGDRLIEALTLPVEAILLTHTHFDHVGRSRNLPSSPMTASHASTNRQDQTMRCAVICIADTFMRPIR